MITVPNLEIKKRRFREARWFAYCSQGSEQQNQYLNAALFSLSLHSENDLVGVWAARGRGPVPSFSLGSHLATYMAWAVLSKALEPGLGAAQAPWPWWPLSVGPGLGGFSRTRDFPHYSLPTLISILRRKRELGRWSWTWQGRPLSSAPLTALSPTPSLSTACPGSCSAFEVQLKCRQPQRQVPVLLSAPVLLPAPAPIMPLTFKSYCKLQEARAKASLGLAERRGSKTFAEWMNKWMSE